MKKYFKADKRVFDGIQNFVYLSLERQESRIVIRWETIKKQGEKFFSPSRDYLIEGQNEMRRAFCLHQLVRVCFEYTPQIQVKDAWTESQWFSGLLDAMSVFIVGLVEDKYISSTKELDYIIGAYFLEK